MNEELETKRACNLGILIMAYSTKSLRNRFLEKFDFNCYISTACCMHGLGTMTRSLSQIGAAIILHCENMVLYGLQVCMCDYRT